jgi:hypothetical protein
MLSNLHGVSAVLWRIYSLTFGVAGIALGAGFLLFQPILFKQLYPTLPPLNAFAANSLATTGVGSLALATMNLVDGQPEAVRSMSMIIVHALHLGCEVLYPIAAGQVDMFNVVFASTGLLLNVLFLLLAQPARPLRLSGSAAHWIAPLFLKLTGIVMLFYGVGFYFLQSRTVALLYPSVRFDPGGYRLGEVRSSFLHHLTVAR